MLFGAVGCQTDELPYLLLLQLQISKPTQSKRLHTFSLLVGSSRVSGCFIHLHAPDTWSALVSQVVAWLPEGRAVFPYRVSFT